MPQDLFSARAAEGVTNARYFILLHKLPQQVAEHVALLFDAGYWRVSHFIFCRPRHNSQRDGFPRSPQQPNTRPAAYAQAVPALRRVRLQPHQRAAQSILAGGYPPDIMSGGQSFWQFHYQNFYEEVICQWQKRFDPAYDTYGVGLANYDYNARVAVTDVANQVA
jgi:hypothetical protein